MTTARAQRSLGPRVPLGKRARLGVLAAALAFAAVIPGCSAPLDCVAPYADVPVTAVAGDSITLHVENLYRACQAEEQRLGEAVTLGEITVTLQSYDGEIYASTTAPFGDDAKATVVLEIPATASGTYEVLADSNLLGPVEVTPAS